MGSTSKQQGVRAYRGQIPSPGRPTVGWREDRVRFLGSARTWRQDRRGCGSSEGVIPVGFRWFRHAGGVNPCLPPAVSGRYLSFSEREDIALHKVQDSVCARSPASSDGHRRRSRVSCVGTRQREARTSTTGRRSRSGTPSGVLAGRKSPSSSRTRSCASTCRTASPVSCTLLTAARSARPAPRGREGTSRIARTADGCRDGARNRSRNDSGSSSSLESREVV